MHSPARVSDGTAPHALGEVAAIAERPEECRATASFGENNRWLVAIAQGHVNDVRGEQPSVFETHPSDLAPLKGLVPFRIEVRENTNPHLGIIEVDGEEFPEGLSPFGGWIPPGPKGLPQITKES